MSTLPPHGPVPLPLLLDWWAGDLPEPLAAEIEERLMSDDETARRVEVLAALGGGITAALRQGLVGAGVTVDTLTRLEEAGVPVRVHQVGDGQLTPCAVAYEPVVAVRLQGRFADLDAVDVVATMLPDGRPPEVRHWKDVAVDRDTGEVVLVYRGDEIRALPHTHVLFEASTADGQPMGVFRLEHSPS